MRHAEWKQRPLLFVLLPGFAYSPFYGLKIPIANLTVSEAAKRVGKNRSTIQRYIQAGKLSASKDNSGICVIDTAELLRVFGSLAPDNETEPLPESEDNTALMATIELLKEQLRAAQARENRLLAMLEHEHETRHQLEQRLLPPSQNDSVNNPKKGFWAKLFGK